MAEYIDRGKEVMTMAKHEHIQAALMYEIEKLFETIQKRGFGYIDRTYIGGIDYKIDDAVYHITITETGNSDGERKAND